MNQEHKLLKLGVWVYFFLLIFEGALRKWFLPSLDAPLLIIRDPIALWIVLYSIYYGIFPKSIFVTLMVIIGIISVFTALFLGHGILPIALFGGRILVIHFPLIFAIGKIFNREDVLKLGKMMIWLTVPMTILLSMQYFLPQTAWVNLGLGGVVEERGFQGANGHFRPSATFSFITGTYLFYGLATSFIFYFWFNPNEIIKPVLILATFGLLAAIPFSISRTLLFEVAVSMLFFFIGASINSKYFGKMAGTIVVGAIVLFVLSKTAFFQDSTDTFVARFTDASATEGGLQGTIGDRFFGGLISAITGSGQLPFFGWGIGLGTNVGSQLYAGGRLFLLHEEEWGRIIDEQGPILGVAVVILRVALVIRLTIGCYARLIKGDMLPWMLLSFGFLAVGQGSWSQPTSLGFCTLIGGLIIASFHSPSGGNLGSSIPEISLPN